MVFKKILLWTLYLVVFIFGVGCARGPIRIINGQSAQLGQFPHQVSLQFEHYHYCGGSILDATHILTAAHCVIDEEIFLTIPADPIRVITGVIDNEARNNSNTFKVARIIPHRRYIPDPLTHDIAILKLARPITFNFFQKPILLPSRNTPSRAQVTASGWGDVDHMGRTMRNLQKLEMITLSLDECRHIYGADITPGHMCAQHASETGMCSGDSGGPLTYHNELVGITSYTRTADTCAENWPDVFTRVYYYIPWIKGVLRRTP